MYKFTSLPTMGLYRYFVLANLICVGFCKDCVLKKPSGFAIQKKLHKDLLCSYRPEDPPNSNGTTLEVKVNYKVVSMQMSEEILTIYGRCTFEWEDDRLIWDSAKYEGLDNILFRNFHIWSPTLNLKGGVGPDRRWFYHANCNVKHTGLVKCHTLDADKYSTVCISSVRNWPYDKKNCILKFDDGSWSHDESNLKFSEFKMILYTDFLNGGWRVHKGRVLENLTGEYQVTIELITGRPWKALEAMALTPTFILPVLTVSSILLDVRDNKRLGILFLSLLGHFYLFSEFSELIQKFGADTPVISLFLSGSTLLTLFVVVFTFISRYFIKITTIPPRFIALFNTLTLNTRAELFVVPRWNYSADHSIEWIDFVNIVNSVSLFVCVLIYIILFSIYTPHDVPGIFLQNVHDT